ncbi:MAG: L,D-transpeptidase [Jatrophihabitans sp.]
MRDVELEELLQGAFDAHARAAVGDHATPMPPRFADPAALDDVVQPRQSLARRAGRWAAPFAAAAAVVGVVVGVVTVASSGTGHEHGAADRPPNRAASHLNQQPVVHVKLLNDDDATYGVGMPVVAYFSQRITDGRALQRATVATVRTAAPKASAATARADGAWYFERSEAGNGPVEAHYRLKGFWPASSKIHISMPIKGLPAGGGLSFDNNLTIDFTTGAKHVATVSGDRHSLSLQVDDKHYGTYPVSLGATKSATRPGVKVIMEKQQSVTRQSVEHPVLPFAQRLTYGGEYLCGAPWNTKDIVAGIDSTSGSTNLRPADAAALYKLLRIGDVVTFDKTSGPAMTMPAGYGDWNVPWTQWLTGGLVPTH